MRVNESTCVTPLKYGDMRKICRAPTPDVFQILRFLSLLVCLGASFAGVVQEDEQARQIRVAQFRDQRQRFVELVASRIVSQGMGSRNTTRKPAAAKLQARTKAPAKKPAQKKPAQMKKPASKASKGMIGKKKPASQHS